MIGLAVGLLIMAALAVPVGRATTGDYFSPATLVIAAWCGTLGLFALRLLPYTPLQHDTVILIAATIALLAAGSLLGIRAERRWTGRRTDVAAADTRTGAPAPRTPVTRQAARASDVSPAQLAGWTFLYAALGLAGTAWYVREVIVRLGWGSFADGDAIRNALNRGLVPSGFLFLQYFSLAAALLAFTLWQTGRLRAWHLLLPAACAIGTLVTTDRTQTFTLLVTAGFIAAFRLGPRLSAWRFTAAALLAVVMLGGNFLLIGIWRASTWDAFLQRVARSAPSAPTGAADVWQGPVRNLAMPYFYATASYPALDHVLHADRPRTNGAMAIYPVARALDRLGVHVTSAPLPPYIPAFVPVTPTANGAAPLETNASTFLYYPLEDFGPTGALVYALLVGLLSGMAYAWARRDRAAPTRLLVWGQVSTALLLTIFVNKFNYTAAWYVLLLTLAPFILARVGSLGRRVGHERVPPATA